MHTPFFYPVILSWKNVLFNRNEWKLIRLSLVWHESILGRPIFVD